MITVAVYITYQNIKVVIFLKHSYAKFSVLFKIKKKLKNFKKFEKLVQNGQNKGVPGFEFPEKLMKSRDSPGSRDIFETVIKCMFLLYLFCISSLNHRIIVDNLNKIFKRHFIHNNNHNKQLFN